jgi:hypothetical protein
MIQMLVGLITYLMLAIYCHEQHGEPVSIQRVRQLRNLFLNGISDEATLCTGYTKVKKRKIYMQVLNRTLLT